MLMRTKLDGEIRYGIRIIIRSLRNLCQQQFQLKNPGELTYLHSLLDRDDLDAELLRSD